MDQKLRTLERRALSGDPSATEALLREQERMGLYNREHFILGFIPTSLAAGGCKTLLDVVSFNFEIHYLTATATALFSFKINDPLGDWSNRPIHSNCLVQQKYELLVPRFLVKGSAIKMELTEESLATNEIRIAFHGIRTNAKEPINV